MRKTAPKSVARQAFLSTETCVVVCPWRLDKLLPSADERNMRAALEFSNDGLGRASLDRIGGPYGRGRAMVSEDADRLVLERGSINSSAGLLGRCRRSASYSRFPLPDRHSGSGRVSLVLENQKGH